MDLYAGAAELIEALPRRVQFLAAGMFVLLLAPVIWLFVA